MAERHKYGQIKGTENRTCKCDDGQVYENCGKHCECCDTQRIAGIRPEGTMAELNPASQTSYGFTNMYDGRIRGGIKTPDAPVRGSQEFNIFDNRDDSTPTMSAPPLDNKIQVIKRLHPLDIAGARRTIGQTVYDPITKVYKVDDGRPRGWYEDEQGVLQIACWGKCKVRRGFWLFKRTTVSCNCNRAASGKGCACNGCLGGSAC